MTLSLSLGTSAIAMSGGVDASGGTGEEYDLTLDGVWTVGDTITLLLTDAFTGIQTQIGAGTVTSITPLYCFTYGNKVYVLAGDTVYFSSVGDPTLFNDVNGVGNGFVTMSNYYASPEPLLAVAPYQGRLAFFSRYTIQIWSVNANPDLWQQQQVLRNIGTLAPLSVQPIGDLDVFFLSDTGIRSLRVRDNTLNAFVTDIGSPLDPIIQTILQSTAPAIAAVACGIVEPSSNRYWLFLKDTIYVLSYFPSNKILAWSRYDATWSNGGVPVAFVPQKFVVFNGQVYCRDDAALYQYGGVDNQVTDDTVCVVESPWLDIKSPGNYKSALGIDLALTGAWKIYAGMDPTSGILSKVYENDEHSFMSHTQPFSARGTHYKWRAVTADNFSAKLSEVIFHFDRNEEK